jgi:hypothetical protein
MNYEPQVVQATTMQQAYFHCDTRVFLLVNIMLSKNFEIVGPRP